MAVHDDVALVLLHGLPTDKDSDPFSPLTKLIEALGTVIPTANIFQYNWRQDIGTDPVLPALRGHLV